LQTVVWISLGAVIGANLRYFVGQFVARVAVGNFPYATMLINLTGSLALGFFMVWTTERVLVDPRWRLFIAIGLCGGYTTYSSFAYETLALFEQGRWLASASNILATNFLCLLGAAAGAALARSL
jgi:CrcB protein